MQIDTKKILTLIEDNPDFEPIEKIADENGAAIIFRNTHPQYMIVALSDNPLLEISDDEMVDIVSRHIFVKYRKAFEELAK